MNSILKNLDEADCLTKDIIKIILDSMYYNYYNFINNIHKTILGNLKPDLIFVLKVSSKVAKKRLKKRGLYIIDINSHNSKTYIQDCFSLAFKIIKQGLSNKLINGPINKTKTLRKKHLGID